MDAPDLLSDSQPGLVHPGAAPVEAGYASISAEGAALKGQGSALKGLIARAEVAPTDRLVLNAGAVLMSGGGRLGAELLPWGGARLAIVSSPGFSLAPFVEGGWAGRESWATAVGLAVEGGGPFLRADASIPLFALTQSPQYAIEGTPNPAEAEAGAAFLFEAGLSARASEHHRIRLGLLSVAPTVGWRGAWEWGFVEADAVVIPVFGAGLSLGAGALF